MACVLLAQSLCTQRWSNRSDPAEGGVHRVPQSAGAICEHTKTISITPNPSMGLQSTTTEQHFWFCPGLNNTEAGNVLIQTPGSKCMSSFYGFEQHANNMLFLSIFLWISNMYLKIISQKHSKRSSREINRLSDSVAAATATSVA